MDHKNAVTLLEATFDNEFSIDRYTNFIKELFNHIKISVRDVPLRKEYYNYVDTVNSLGVYRDSDKRSIEVFAIKLKRTSSRDRARTMQRNLIARYLSQFNRDAALVAFYGDDPEDWRFSFVKMEYELTKDEKGNLKVTEELTPARRHSFLVGKNESNHTCKIQFIGLIKEEDEDPNLSEIEEKFSIENVTKEFFTAYKKLFLDLKESLEEVIDADPRIKNEFEDKNILTTDFAKKLLGQIVFIYFLQKKGWLGVKKQDPWGAGPKNFLRKLFDGEMANYDNFFNELLEPLFYEALATERDGDYYSKFNCRIPFLNGGLFEPINDYDWIDTDITLNNEIFREVIDTFDLFNFTVKEDEPLEKEVAVDPEMLGKVFENLLEVTDRKSKGAFYTPREIVHYMCQQSLVNYLKTHIPPLPKKDIEKFILKGDLALDSIIREQEQKKTYHGRIFQKQVLPESIKENSVIINKLLQDIKVVDPAVGSGAFPVGMMNEIVRARHIISLLSEKEINSYNLKRETIENSLYGVDIDSSAVDITKLRFWLSLVVDEEDIQNIKPLPNLDHKIMCGNSLIEEFEGMKLLDETLLEASNINPEIERIIEQKEYLQKKLDILRIETPKNIDKITEIDNQLSKLRKKEKKIKSKTNDRTQANLFASESEKNLKILEKKQDEFFNAESPNKKKLFRKEIESIEWAFIEETVKSEGNEKSIHKLKKFRQNKSKPFFLWKLYFAEVYQRKNPGFDVVIANPPYVFGGNKGISTEEKKIFKENYISGKGKTNLFTIFIEQGTRLLRNKGFLIYITPNTLLRVTSYTNIRELMVKNKTINEIMDLDVGVFENVTSSTIVFSLTNEKSDLENKIPIKKNLIRTPMNTVKQKDFDNKNYIFNIFCTPDERAIIQRLKVKSKNLGSISRILRFGVVITKNKEEVVGKKKINNDWKPFLEGNEIGKYSINYSGRYLHYQKELLHRSRTPDVFESKKIMIQRITGGKEPIKATYDDSGYYNKESIINLILSDENEFYYEYILCLINSKLMNWFYSKEYSNESKLTVNLSKEYLSEIPIKIIPLEKQKTFLELADKILEIKNNNDYSKNSKKYTTAKKMEGKIDDLVYELYDLTSVDIAIVKQFFQ